MVNLTQSAAKTRYDWLPATVCIILSVGMFPSLTAISGPISEAFPVLGRSLGPINPLKLFSPLILAYLWLNRSRLSSRAKTVLVASAIIGTIGTLLAAGLYGYTPYYFREWAVMFLGVAASVCLLLLPIGLIKATLLSWAVIIFGGVFLNIVFPGVLSSINLHFFDPIRIISPGSSFLLMGFYDVASLAKLLAWIPWILLWGYAIKKNHLSRLESWGALFFLATCTVLTIATTQRGPFLGILFGWVAFMSHQAFRSRNREMLLRATACLLLGLSLIPVFVPRNIIESRFRPLLSRQSSTPTSEYAYSSVLHRLELYRKTVKLIAHHPLGLPVASEDQIRNGELFASHSHNLFLEQFKARGWLWGLTHLLLWIYALGVSWKRRDVASSAMFGGIATAVGIGLSDHPWFVLNHAMILGVLLFAGVVYQRDKSQGEPPELTSG